MGIVAGNVVGSRLGDRYHRVRPGWRVAVGGVGLLVGGIAFAVALVVPVLPVTIVGMVVANVGFSAAIPNLTAAVADVLRAADRGMGFAALQLLLTLGGAAGPGLVGATSDITGSLRAGLWALVSPMLAGAVWAMRGRRAYEHDLEALAV